MSSTANVEESLKNAELVKKLTSWKQRIFFLTLRSLCEIQNQYAPYVGWSFQGFQFHFRIELLSVPIFISARRGRDKWHTRSVGIKANLPGRRRWKGAGVMKEWRGVIRESVKSRQLFLSCRSIGTISLTWWLFYLLIVMVNSISHLELSDKINHEI